MNNKANLILIHILGCVIILASPLLFTPNIVSGFEFIGDTGFRRDLFFAIFLILFFYLSYFILVPKLYFNKRHFAFFNSVLLCFVFICFLTLLLFPRNPIPPGMSPPHILNDLNKNALPPPPPGLPFFINEFRKFSLQFFIVFIFSLMLKINTRWKQSEKEKLDAELAYLKAQINPHFLFNTLNSIYSLAIVKSDNVASSIVKLSNMMRYVLSESSNDLVRLEKEIEYIQNFIELQQIRFGTFIKLDCSITGDAKNKMIAPLILIPFIENAYKHGVNAEEESIIKVKIEISENQLFLSVKNNKVFVQRMEEAKSGLGVENTKNRLRYIYPRKHELIINNSEKEYSVSLTLDLK